MLFSLVRGLPSTTPAARISPALFGGFAGTMPLFDSSPAYLPGLCFWLPGPVRGLVGPRMPTRSLGSRARSFSTCVRLWDYAGPDGSSRLRPHQCGLPLGSTRSAPGIRFSKLDSSPVDASVYTSPGNSRYPAQDMRSRWFATPYLVGLFHPRLHAGLSRRLRFLTVAVLLLRAVRADGKTVRPTSGDWRSRN